MFLWFDLDDNLAGVDRGTKVVRWVSKRVGVEVVLGGAVVGCFSRRWRR